MSKPMKCLAGEAVCPCSLVTTSGGACKFGPRLTLSDAFPYLTTTRGEQSAETNESEGSK